MVKASVTTPTTRPDRLVRPWERAGNNAGETPRLQALQWQISYIHLLQRYYTNAHGPHCRQLSIIIYPS